MDYCSIRLSDEHARLDPLLKADFMEWNSVTRAARTARGLWSIAFSLRGVLEQFRARHG